MQSTSGVWLVVTRRYHISAWTAWVLRVLSFAPILPHARRNLLPFVFTHRLPAPALGYHNRCNSPSFCQVLKRGNCAVQTLLLCTQIAYDFVKIHTSIPLRTVRSDIA